MNKSEILLQAIDESAATTYTLTRLAKDNSDTTNGVLDNFLRDVQIHDAGATAEVDGDGNVTVTTRIGGGLEYIMEKYGFKYTAS